MFLAPRSTDALGLVFYELFTGKRAFKASSLGEFHRKQTETNPTPPSSVVKNFDPAVERAILRCLDRDPSQRPSSALAVAAALPGGDPLAAALGCSFTYPRWRLHVHVKSAPSTSDLAIWCKTRTLPATCAFSGKMPCSALG